MYQADEKRYETMKYHRWCQWADAAGVISGVMA